PVEERDIDGRRIVYGDDDFIQHGVKRRDGRLEQAFIAIERDDAAEPDFLRNRAGQHAEARRQPGAGFMPKQQGPASGKGLYGILFAVDGNIAEIGKEPELEAEQVPVHTFGISVFADDDVQERLLDYKLSLDNR